MSNEWPLWEIFIRSQHGLAHKHVGSLHAPDAEMAIKNARDVYTRRNEGVSHLGGAGRRDITASTPGRQGRAVRAGQQQGLPPPDVFPDAGRSEAPMKRPPMLASTVASPRGGESAPWGGPADG